MVETKNRAKRANIRSKFLPKSVHSHMNITKLSICSGFRHQCTYVSRWNARWLKRLSQSISQTWLARHPELSVATCYQSCFWLHALIKREKTSFCFVSSAASLSVLEEMHFLCIEPERATVKLQIVCFRNWILIRQTSFGADLALDLASFPLASDLCAKL